MLNRLQLLLAITVAAVLLAVPVADAASIADRVQVGDTARATRGFPHSLALTLKLPRSYQRGCCYDGADGEWTGPDFHASGHSGVSGPSRLAWNVRFVHGGSLKHLARHVTADRRISGRRVKVKQTYAKRTIARLPAYRAIGVERAPGAEVVGALAVALDRRVRALVEVRASDPPVDRGWFGRLTIKGSKPSVWSRKHIEAALAGVTLEGNSRPKHVTARRRGSKIRGAVVDVAGHRMPNLTVALRRGKRTVATAQTTRHGTYSLSAPGRGSYRVAANLSRTTVLSKRVKVR